MIVTNVVCVYRECVSEWVSEWVSGRVSEWALLTIIGLPVVSIGVYFVLLKGNKHMLCRRKIAARHKNGTVVSHHKK